MMGQDEFCMEAIEIGQELEESWEQVLSFCGMILFWLI